MSTATLLRVSMMRLKPRMGVMRETLDLRDFGCSGKHSHVLSSKAL